MSDSKIYNDPYADGLHQAVMELCRDFPDIRSYVLKIQSARSVFDAYYQVLVKKGELTPVELLNSTLKTSLWEQTKELAPTERIKAAHALYLIEKIFEK